VKLNRSIAISFVLMAGIATGTCPAQSSNDPQETITESGSTQVSAVAVPSATQPTAVSGKTREQVVHELADFQNSAQAAELREIYRGN
jgi:hypothetical protein